MLSDDDYRRIWREAVFEAITYELERPKMDTTLRSVKDFHMAFGLEAIKEKPSEPALMALMDCWKRLAETAKLAHETAALHQCPHLLRVQLMTEELAEFVEAVTKWDRKEMLHELADCRVVNDGTAIAYGLENALVPAVLEIGRANMSKLGADGKPVLSEAGRVMKGPAFRKADVTSCLTVEPKLLDLPLEQPNEADARTVRDYLKALLTLAWTEEETFDGKRPFGNGGWRHTVIDALVAGGVIATKETDFDQGVQEVAAAIQGM